MACDAMVQPSILEAANPSSAGFGGSAFKRPHKDNENKTNAAGMSASFIKASLD
jgi:hypothetical protein